MTTTGMILAAEQMRERCLHDLLLLLRQCAADADHGTARALRAFSRACVENGVAGWGTGTCDCEADDCPYKAATVPCDCGLPDCSDPRSEVKA